MRLTGLTRPIRIDENALFHTNSSGDADDSATKPLPQIEMDTFCAPELSTSKYGFEVDLYSIGQQYMTSPLYDLWC